MFKITYFTNSHGRRFSKEYFQALLQGVDGVVGQKSGNISVNLLTNEKIRHLNKHYRGKDKPTDVLSFAYNQDMPGVGEDLFGEIFLAPDVVTENAPKSGNTFEQELKFIFIHGVLHLLGYDHENDADEQEMNSLTNEILGGAGGERSATEG